MSIGTSDDKLWLLVQNQLPDFMRHDEAYGRFLAFVQAYYKFLQEPGELRPVELISDAEFHRNIDFTLDRFVEHFASYYLDGFPIVFDNDAADSPAKTHHREQMKGLVKGSADLYTSKSIEDAYRTLFRALYDEEIQFFYPKTVILKASDGRWQRDITVKIFVASGDITAVDLTYGSAAISEMAGVLDTGARATVESIIGQDTGSGVLYELFLTPDSIVNPTRAYGDIYAAANSGATALPFAPGNTLTLTTGNLTITGVIQTAINAIAITSTAAIYDTGSELRVAKYSGTWQEHPVARVNVKSVFEDGRIKAINIVDSGYSFDDTYSIIDAADNIVATIGLSGITRYPGYFSEVKGFLSDQMRLRGPKPSRIYATGHGPADYYQEFSYVINSGVAVSTWKQIVKNVLHPIGYEVFGEVSLLQEGDGVSILGLLEFNTDDINDPEINGNGGYLFHLLQLLLIQTMTLTPQQVAEVAYALLLVSTPDNLLGPTYESIDRFKFLYPDYAGGPTPFGTIVPASNAAYAAAVKVIAWDAGVTNNTQISVFADMVVGDFYDGNARGRKTNICPEPYMLFHAYP